MPKKTHHHHHHYYHHGDAPGKDGYAYRAGAGGPGPNRYHLHRNMRRGKIAGVCAGIADYLNVKVKWVRLGAILSTIFFFPAPIIIYLIAAFILKPGEPFDMAYADPEEDKFWRSYSARPKATMSELKHRSRAIDARIAQMEHAVTSNEFGLRREFRDLERGV